MTSDDKSSIQADDFNEWHFTSEAVSLLARAAGAIERLDEQVKRSPVGRPWSERVLFRQACAAQLLQGRLVHEDELVTLDAGLRRSTGYPELMETLEMLECWRAALAGDALELLRGERPGVGLRVTRTSSNALRKQVDLTGRLAHAGASADVGIDTIKLNAWRRHWRDAQQVSPVLQSALVLDRWRELSPEPGHGWRGSLLAALVLRARGLASNLLLPIDIGWQATKVAVRPEQPRFDRILGIVRWMEAAAIEGQKDLANLGLAYIPLKRALRGRRKHSRLPALARLFMALPVVSVPMAARHLGCSPQAIDKMIPLLGSSVRLISEGRQFRAWTAP